jgi:hypothetical protein
MEEEGEKMEELNSSNENNRTIRPIGDPRNWYTSQTQLPDTASSSSSSTTELENDIFSLEIMICGHADLPTEIKYQYGAEEIKVFESEIETCVFSYAPVADCAYFWGITESGYKKNIIKPLEKLSREGIHNIEYETLREIITNAEKLTSGRIYQEGMIYQQGMIKNNSAYKKRSHSVSCGKKQFEKSFDFFGEKAVDSNAVFGIFILKFVRFRSGYAFNQYINLLGLDIFINYMSETYGKHIIPIRDSNKDGFEVLNNNSEKSNILLSEIISFFKHIDRSNEISTLNIVDLTCSVISKVISEDTSEVISQDTSEEKKKDRERLNRRLSRAAHYGPDSENREQFGGKKINLRYLPRRLTRKDKKKQINMLLKSRRLYKKGDYYTRKKVNSFQSKKSQHIINAEKIYGVNKIGATDELVKKTGCTKKALAKIINKGAGAYFSSGSRPNQTAQSWGIARLASAITSGKAAAVDYNILEKGCKPNSKALKMAKNAKKKYGHGTRRVPKVKI